MGGSDFWAVAVFFETRFVFEGSALSEGRVPSFVRPDLSDMTGFSRQRFLLTAGIRTVLRPGWHIVGPEQVLRGRNVADKSSSEIFWPGQNFEEGGLRHILVRRLCNPT